MEFNEKLQELRKRKGITQEELAEAIFVSRAAVSKWESGRGYPSIDSLKILARFFSVTVDELISGEQILNIAEDDRRERARGICDLIFGLTDVCFLLLIFLPFFALRGEGGVQGGSLLALDGTAVFLKIIYFALVIGASIMGVLTLALQNLRCGFWLAFKYRFSLIIGGFTVALLILGLHPYAAVFAFTLLLIKCVVLIKAK